MPAETVRHHVSGAVVAVLPGSAESAVAMLRAMPGVEVHACERGRIVITIEGDGTRALGDTLSRIALSDGVVSANMVFEQSLESEDTAS